MSHDQSYPFPQVFMVEGGDHPQHPMRPPGLIPCWSFPPAQERVRAREKSRGVSSGTALVVLLLFLLTFAALGFEAYQIFNIQKELRAFKKAEPATEVISPQMQVGVREPEKKEQDKNSQPAAHVIGRIETVNFPHTLRWELKSGQAFTSGGVTYLATEGALQVNETGIYHIYSRVELLLKDCSPGSEFDHSMYVKRKGHSSRITLVKAHRAGFCSQGKTRLSWTTDSYLGSIHQLKEDDEVYVDTSLPEELSHSHEGNFFGLYKI